MIRFGSDEIIAIYVHFILKISGEINVRFIRDNRLLIVSLILN